eukprot:6178663-Pleurochrysis_carterae.AAC.2
MIREAFWMFRTRDLRCTAEARSKRWRPRTHMDEHARAVYTCAHACIHRLTRALSQLCVRAHQFPSHFHAYNPISSHPHAHIQPHLRPHPATTARGNQHSYGGTWLRTPLLMRVPRLGARIECSNPHRH